MNGHWELMLMLRHWSREHGVVFDEAEAATWLHRYWNLRLLETGELQKLPGTRWCGSHTVNPNCRCWLCRAGGLQGINLDPEQTH